MEVERDRITGDSVTTRMKQLQMLRREADVLMLESMFAHAVRKYTVITTELVQIEKMIGKQKWIPQVLSACHINIAGCFLEMKRNFSLAEKHCRLALDLQPDNQVAIIRHGQSLHALERFSEALEILQNARIVTKDAIKHALITTMIDKCHFDQSQNDRSFIIQTTCQQSLE